MNFAIRNVLTTVLFIVLLLGISLSTALPVHAQETSREAKLQQIQMLLAMVAELKAKLEAMRGTASNNTVTIDQSSVKSRNNSFELSGTAAGIDNLFVALVRPHTSNPTDWRTVYETGQYVAFTGDSITKIKNGKWEVEFNGVIGGDYEVRVYGGKQIEQRLLLSQPLKVSAPKTIEFGAEDEDEITLGVGQTADDGGVSITLNDVFLTNGLSGTPRATFVIQPDGYKAGLYSGSLHEYVPEGGAITDRKVEDGGIRFKIEELSVSQNTATIKIDVLEKG